MAKILDIFVIIYFNNIFTYIKDPDHDYVKVVKCIFDVPKKEKLYINQTKYKFHIVKFWFLRYVILAQRIKIEDNQIKILKN